MSESRSSNQHRRFVSILIVFGVGSLAVAAHVYRYWPFLAEDTLIFRLVRLSAG